MNRLAVLSLVILVTTGGDKAAAGFTPWRAIGKAVASDESARSQAESKRLQTQLRMALLADQGLGGLKLSAEVYMGHAFIVGFVASREQQERVAAAVKDVPVREAHYYLPVKTDTSGESECDTDADNGEQTPAFLVAKQIRGALRQYNALETLKLKVKVLDGVAVLTGVVRSREEHDAVIAAAGAAPGIVRVIDFLLYPEPGREKIISTPEIQLPRRR